jgi:hypothetical protein
MNSASWAALGMGWIAVHFGVYAVVLRFLPAFRRESVIFAYQAGSFASLMLVAVAGAIHAAGPVAFALSALLISLHGIYSLSFLELWALSEGGYSLRLLHLIDRGAMEPGKPDRELGAAKLAKRLGALGDLGLIRVTAGQNRLTWPGRCAAAFFAGILWLTAGRSLTR